MNFPVRLLAILVVATFALFARADDQPNIPASAWEQHKEGIALAEMLGSRTDNGRPISSIWLYVKNTSKPVFFPEAGYGSLAFEVFYFNRPQEQTPLRQYGHKSTIGIPLPTQSPTPPIGIKHGEIRWDKIDLTSEELTLIKGRLVKCSILITDETLHRHFKVESSPKILVAGQ